MPQLGSGMLPSGAIGTELTYVTRRAFIPKLVVQIYQSTPTLSLLMRNSQRAKGGASQITVPVQGSSFVNFAWTDYSGSFAQPAVQTAVTNAEFNLSLGVVPIPFLGVEGLVQASEAIVPLLKARMADAKTVAVQQLSTALFANNSASPLVLNGLPQAYDNGTLVPTYGGINRTTAANTFWQAQMATSAGGILTRAAQLSKLMQVTKGAGGEAPDVVIMSFQDWTTLAQDFMSAEVFQSTPGSQYTKEGAVNAGFRSLRIGQTSFYADPFLAKGTEYMVNSKYLALYLSEDAPFAFSGFYSTIPNLQIGNIGVVLVALQVVCDKPVSGMQITGITGGASF